MGERSDRSLVRYLPLVAVATFVVAIAPLLLVRELKASGTVTSAWVALAIGVGTAFLASFVGEAFWKTRAHSADILFNDLMLWGWIQRWRSGRRLNAASDLLGLTAGRPGDGRARSNAQKAALLTRLTSDLEARDPYTYGHSRRVARHAAIVARGMGLTRAEAAKVRAAGAMHDVGKVHTPIAVLRKEGALTREEYEVIKRHPADGAAMVAALGDPELTALVRHHHERPDGGGYPDGLRGEEIPLGARILAVADTFDAITSTRPYRHASTHKAALTILASGAGTQLDPDVVRTFCKCYAGRRPLALWTLLVHGRPRFAALLGGGLGPAKAAGAASLVSTATTAAAVGGILAGLGTSPAVAPPRALADAVPSPPTTRVSSRGPAAWRRAAAPPVRSAAAWKAAAATSAPARSAAAWKAAAGTPTGTAPVRPAAAVAPKHGKAHGHPAARKHAGTPKPRATQKHASARKPAGHAHPAARAPAGATRGPAGLAGAQASRAFAHPTTAQHRAPRSATSPTPVPTRARGKVDRTSPATPLVRSRGRTP